MREVYSIRWFDGILEGSITISRRGIGDRFLIEQLEQIVPVTAVSGKQCGFPPVVVIKLA